LTLERKNSSVIAGISTLISKGTLIHFPQSVFFLPTPIILDKSF